MDNFQQQFMGGQTGQMMGMGYPGYPQMQPQMMGGMGYPQPQFGAATAPFIGGVTGGVQINPVNIRNASTLSKEDAELLKGLGIKQFQITPEAVAKSHCNHRHPENGMFTLEEIGAPGSGRYRCSICKEEFNLVQPTPEAAAELVSMFNDFFQSIKTLWYSVPKEWAEQVYSALAIINQLPEMYKVAIKDWQQIEKQINGQVQPAYAGGAFSNYMNGYPQMQVQPQFMGGMMGGFQPQMQPQMMGGMMGFQPQMMGGQMMMPGQAMGGFQQQMPTAVGGAMNMNPFYQNGATPVQQQQMQQPQMNNTFGAPQMQQQQATPQQQVQAPAAPMSIPMPGAPQQVTPQVQEATKSASIRV